MGDPSGSVRHGISVPLGRVRLVGLSQGDANPHIIPDPQSGGTEQRDGEGWDSAQDC
jgi:hypothetical protein